MNKLFNVGLISHKSQPIVLGSIVLFIFNIPTNIEANNYEWESHLEYEDAYKTDQIQEGSIQLASNEDTTLDRLQTAYETLREEQHLNDVYDDIYQFFKNNLGQIKTKKVALQVEKDEGLLFVSLKLIDGVILTINKRITMLDSHLVGFNLYQKRHLLLSDIRDIADLVAFICNVQNRKG